MPDKVWKNVSAFLAVVLLAVGVGAPGAARADTVNLHSGWKETGAWTQVTDDRSYWAGNYWGTGFNDAGEGPFHGIAWNCPASAELVGDVFYNRGYCTLTDSDGDKISATMEGQTAESGLVEGYVTFTSGTGKFAGISGGHDFRCRTIGTEGQYLCQQKVEYTLR